jgi:hypothetical protein
MKAVYPSKSCDKVYGDLSNIIALWKTGDPGKGLYAVKEAKVNTYIWVTRTTPVKHYVDDIAFELS